MGSSWGPQNWGGREVRRTGRRGCALGLIQKRTGGLLAGRDTAPASEPPPRGTPAGGAWGPVDVLRIRSGATLRLGVTILIMGFSLLYFIRCERMPSKNENDIIPLFLVPPLE